MGIGARRMGNFEDTKEEIGVRKGGKAILDSRHRGVAPLAFSTIKEMSIKLPDGVKICVVDATAQQFDGYVASMLSSIFHVSDRMNDQQKLQTQEAHEEARKHVFDGINRARWDIMEKWYALDALRYYAEQAIKAKAKGRETLVSTRYERTALKQR